MKKLLALLFSCALVLCSCGTPEDDYPIQNGDTIAEDPGYTVQASGISPYQSAASPEPQTITVYVTNTGEKYHRAGCQYLRKSCNAIDLDTAKLSYTPCSKCNPPV